MTTKTIYRNGDMAKALRHGLRDFNEAPDIDRILMDFVFKLDRHNVDMARELLFEMLENYKRDATQ